MSSPSDSLLNILSIDVEDYFQVSAFDSIVERSQWDRYESRVERNTQKILEQLSLREVKGTFFVLGWVAEKFPSIVRSIHKEGHEVACHGYSHRLVYEQSPQEFRQETRRAKKLLEDISGVALLSYRAASYSITRKSAWALEILAEEGFIYDSSIFPVYHDRYGIPEAPRVPHRLALRNGQELVEFPISTIRLLGMNLPMSGGGYFRLLPYSLTKLAVHRLNKTDGLPLVFYLHPWEFDPEQPLLPVRGLSRFRHYLNLDSTRTRFDHILQDFRFAPLTAVAAAAMSSFSVDTSQYFKPSGVSKG